MRRSVRIMLGKAVDSLILSIEHFNRPDDRGRIPSVLIMLDHSFEMLLKASILHRGGKIRKPREKLTVGFDECVRKGLNDGSIKFISDEQALTLQTINGLRDASYHHYMDLSEQMFYIYTQTGVTLFRDILKKVFEQDLSAHLPERVLPVSTVAPTSLHAVFRSETDEIRKLLRPGKRRRTEALARLRPLAILDATIQGERSQPSTAELSEKGKKIAKGTAWDKVFRGVSSLKLTSEGTGPHFDLRITKKTGIPVTLVSRGTPGAPVVAVKRVNELDFYSMGRNQLALKVGLSGNKTSAMIWHLGLQQKPECYKLVRLGKSQFKRYSPEAIKAIQEALKTEDVEKVWHKYSKWIGRKRRRQAA